MFIFEFIGLWFMSFFVIMAVTFWEYPRSSAWISGAFSAAVIAAIRFGS